jgi:hypothetical protein
MNMVGDYADDDFDVRLFVVYTTKISLTRAV